jgi:hypothetical protein
MGLTAGLDILNNTKISLFCRESNTHLSSSYPTHHKNKPILLADIYIYIYIYTYIYTYVHIYICIGYMICHK